MKVCRGLFGRITHPGCYSLPHPVFESIAESTIAIVAAVVSQLPGGERMPGSYSLTIETDKMVDAQIVNISIVTDALTGEIVGKISAIGSNSIGQLKKVQVVLQIEFCIYTMLL